MDKKVLSFFVASSIEDLEKDRESVAAFVTQLNNIYEPYNIFIRMHLCEGYDIDHSIQAGGSQHQLDKLICNSDLCFVIFFEKVGKYTLHELELAVNHYVKNNRPKVVVYFKQIPSDKNVPDEIKSVMKKIDEDLLHYHREYAHIDSLKLGIVTQLQALGFVNLDLKVEDSRITCNNTALISIESIPLFGDNEEYILLYEEYRQVLKECADIKKKALCEQITTIDKRQCRKYLGRLSFEETEAIKAAAIYAIGGDIDIPEEIEAP